MSQNFLLQFPRAQSSKTQRYSICTHLNQIEINSKKLNPHIWKISKQQIFGILDMVQTLNYWIDMAVKIGSEVHIPLRMNCKILIRMEKNILANIWATYLCMLCLNMCVVLQSNSSAHTAWLCFPQPEPVSSNIHIIKKFAISTIFLTIYWGKGQRIPEPVGNVIIDYQNCCNLIFWWSTTCVSHVNIIIQDTSHQFLKLRLIAQWGFGEHTDVGMLTNSQGQC